MFEYMVVTTPLDGSNGRILAGGDAEFCARAMEDAINRDDSPLVEAAAVVRVIARKVSPRFSAKVYEQIDSVLDGQAGRIQEVSRLLSLELENLELAGDDGTYLEPLRDVIAELERAAEVLPRVGE